MTPRSSPLMDCCHHAPSISGVPSPVALGCAVWPWGAPPHHKEAVQSTRRQNALPFRAISAGHSSLPGTTTSAAKLGNSRQSQC